MGAGNFPEVIQDTLAKRNKYMQDSGSYSRELPCWHHRRAKVFRSFVVTCRTLRCAPKPQHPKPQGGSLANSPKHQIPRACGSLRIMNPRDNAVKTYCYEHRFKLHTVHNAVYTILIAPAKNRL